MRPFFEALESGRLLDFVVLFMALELGVLGALVARRRRSGRSGGLTMLDLVGHLSAGAFLVLALRSALVGADRPGVAGRVHRA